MEFLLALLITLGTLSCANSPQTQAARAGKCQDYEPVCILGSFTRCEINRDGCRTCTCENIRSPEARGRAHFPGE